MNPLLTLDLHEHKIDFSVIKPEHFADALDTLLPKILKEHEVAANEAPLEFKALFDSQPNQERLSKLHSLLYHLYSVVNSPEYQEVFENFDETLSGVYTKFSLDERIYYKLCAFTHTQNFANLSFINQQMVYDHISSMEDNGINLEDSIKEQLYKNSNESSAISSLFSNNLMQSQLNSFIVFSEDELVGLPERAIQILHTCEVEKEVDGVKFYKIPFSKGLNSDIMIYCENEHVRKICFERNLEIATTGDFDNREVVKKFADIYQENATIMGFKNYSEKRLRKNMAKNSEQAIKFVDDIVEKVIPFAKEEQKELIAFGENLLKREMQMWDFGYIKNLYATAKFDFDPEDVRQYFTVKPMMNGFFEIFETLYKIKFNEIYDETAWHKDVKIYSVVDENNNPIGKIYFDLYLREHKQQGAWMMTAIDRDETHDGKITLPVVYVVCNAPKDEGEEPTLSFDEVNTFFHEMGHAFHQLLTKVNCGYFSGLNNVQKDAIELPSQFMENFIYDYEILKKITCHAKTKEHLPKELFDKILNSKNFNSGLHLVRQCILAKTDLVIYSQPGSHPIEVERAIREEWKVSDRFQSSSLICPSFSHIFGGGYSSGYYSYLWAEVLAADSFAALKESGSNYLEQISASDLFKKHILEVGGFDDMSYNFKNFRGRDPEVRFLLESYGIPA